jgi:hypothetical protein
MNIAIVKKFDLTLPWKQTPSSTQYDTHVIKGIEDFVFGKQNGFLALLDGEVDRALSAVSHFARQSQEKYLGLRLFHLDFDDTQFGSVKSIGDLDRVFAQIATDLLEMPDLLNILVDADRGSGLVECILRTANERAKARWILIINNITIPMDTFLRHDVTQGDYIRWPKIPVQGSVIMTSSKQPQLPEALDVYPISQEPAPPQSLYEDANADFKFDYILTSGEFSRLRLQPSSRSGPRDPSAERWRPMLNLVRPTPPSSPVVESSVVSQNDIVIEYDEDPETRFVSPWTNLSDHVQMHAQTMSSQKSVAAYIEDVDSDDSPRPDTRKLARSKQEPNTSQKKSSSFWRIVTTTTIDSSTRRKERERKSSRKGKEVPERPRITTSKTTRYHEDHFGEGARPIDIPHNGDRLASGFEARPRSSMGNYGSSFEDRYADFEAPSPSLSKRTTKNDEDRRQMPPPPRPSTAGPRQHSGTSFLPLILSRQVPALKEDGPGSDGESLSPVRPTRPEHTRRQSLGSEDVKDKISDANIAQDAAANTAPVPVPLTPDNLRRVKQSTSSRSTRSSASRDESSFRQSETTAMTSRLGSDDEDVTIKVPHGAVVEYDGIKIKCAKGGELTLGRGDRGSDRGTIYGDELRTHANRTERSGTRPRSSSQATHARRPRAIMSPSPHDHAADYPDNPMYYGAAPYAPYHAYPPYDDDGYDHVFDT